MAIRTTIQMRRGRMDDFDPSKLLPGEWAVSIDADTKKQVVWMCFAAGVVKRMGTYEDFKWQFEELAEEIKEQYIKEFNAIQEEMERLESQAASSAATATQKATAASTSAANAATSATTATQKATAASASATNAANSALLAKSYSDGDTGIREGESTDNSKFYSEQSKRSSDTSKEYLGKVEQAGNEAVKKLKDALDVDAPNFQMDLSTGHLMYEGGRFMFHVNNSGHLEWRLTV